MFITIEGLDGVGKSTIAGLLASQIRKEFGRDVVITSDLAGTDTGKAVREILVRDAGNLTVEHQLQLIDRARQANISLVIRPALAKRNFVICDRWVDSTFAYQIAGFANDPALMQTHMPLPSGYNSDLNILLDLDPREALARTAGRGAKDSIENKGIDFFERVRSALLYRSTLRSLTGHNSTIIDASRRQTIVARNAFLAVRDVFESKKPPAEMDEDEMCFVAAWARTIQPAGHATA